MNGDGTARKRLALLTAFVLTSLTLQALPAQAAPNPSANLDHCANGPLGAQTDCTTDGEWRNGANNAAKASYEEGHSVPQRVLFGNLPTTPGSSQTIVVTYDTQAQAGRHAFDYLTTVNASESLANPCAGVNTCNPAVFDTEPIPVDNDADFKVPNEPDPPANRGDFRLYGGNITGLSVGRSGLTRRISITFSADRKDPVLAFGAHIAHRDNWGQDGSAGAISGSSYHTGLDGFAGSQDHQMSTSAVILPGSITVVKDAAPAGDEPFGFTSTNPASGFSLIDDDGGPGVETRTFGNIMTFPTKSVITEDFKSGWTLSDIVCSVASANGGSQDVDVPQRLVDISLNEGEKVTCTFKNTKDADPTADLSVTKSGPTAATAGDQLTYAVTVTNGGPAAATTVKVEDLVSPGLKVDSLAVVEGTGNCGTTECTFASINSGESVKIEVKATVSDNPPDKVVNTAKVSAATADPNTGNNEAKAETTTTPKADVEVTKTGPATASAGDQLTYTVTATNNGPSDLATYPLTDLVTGGLTLDAAVITDTTTPCTIAADKLSATCQLTNFTKDKTFTIEVKATVGNNVDGTVTNTASVPDNPTDPDRTNNSQTVTTTVGLKADVEVTKTGPATASAGDQLTYTVTATNNGPSDLATYPLTDLVTGGLTLDSAVITDTTTPCTIAADKLSATCQLTNFTKDKTFTIEVKATVGNNVDGTVTNTASVPDNPTDPDRTNNSQTVTTTVGLKADVEITKTLDKPDNYTATAGELLDYTVIAINHGPSDLATYPLTDIVSDGLTITSADITDPSPATPCTIAADKLSATCQLINFTKGKTFTIKITAKVADNPPTQVTNTATGPTPPGDATPPKDDVVTPAAPKVDVKITKTADPAGEVKTDSLITFRLLAENSGPSTAADVVVTDTLGTGLSFDSAAPETPGTGSCTRNGQAVTCVPTDGQIAANGGVAFLVRATVTALSGNVVNGSTITTTTPGDDPGNNSSGTSNPIAPDVTVLKSANKLTVKQNDTVVYTVAATNSGTSTATGVVVTDTLGAGLEYISAGPKTAGTGSCTRSGQVITCKPTGDALAPGTVIFEITAKVTATSGTVRNSVVIASANDNNPNNNTSEVTLTVTPLIRIDDVTVTEPANGATTTATFSVTLSGPSTQPVTVNYATADGTDESATVKGATAPADYAAKPTTTLTFAPGTTSLPVDVTVKGDLFDEVKERYFVNLTNPSANAAVDDPQGIGYILDSNRNGTTSCQATGVRTRLGVPALINIGLNQPVANPQDQPCIAHSPKSIASVSLTSGLNLTGTAKAVNASTTLTPADLNSKPPAVGDQWGGRASLTTLDARLGLLGTLGTISATALETTATARCATEGALPTLEGTSKIANLKVKGTIITDKDGKIVAQTQADVDGNVYVSVAGVGKLYINYKKIENGVITMRGLFLKVDVLGLDLVDLVLAESKADHHNGNPCAV